MDTYKKRLQELQDFDFSKLYASYANRRQPNEGEEFDHEEMAKRFDENMEYYKGVLDDIDAGK